MEKILKQRWVVESILKGGGGNNFWEPAFLTGAGGMGDSNALSQTHTETDRYTNTDPSSSSIQMYMAYLMCFGIRCPAHTDTHGDTDLPTYVRMSQLHRHSIVHIPFSVHLHSHTHVLISLHIHIPIHYIQNVHIYIYIHIHDPHL